METPRKRSENEATATLVLALGTSEVSRRVLSHSANDVSGVGPEGFVVTVMHRNGVVAVAGSGRAAEGLAAASKGDRVANIGATYSVYAALETVLGFAFLHPLQPVPPARLCVASSSLSELPEGGVVRRLSESPHWPVRGTHVRK